MKRLIAFAVAAFVAWSVNHYTEAPVADSSVSAPRASAPVRSSPATWRAGEQVRGSGVVTRILPDDNDGSRHQRFILRIESGRTLLVAHNIDLAPRIASLREGDRVAFYGEYEPNDKGGVIHWTHRDPQGRHVGGWLEHRGRRYE